MSQIDVIIPCYNNPTQVKACVLGFDKQSFNDFKVWLCVNGDPQSISKVIDELELSIELNILSFDDKLNHGRAANRNQALNKLSSKYTVYHDSDLIPSLNMLNEHLEICKDANTISIGMAEYQNVNSNLWAIYQYHAGRSKYKHLDSIPMYYLNTQNVMIPTHILQELNGQDEGLTGYGGDDTELGYRISKRYDTKAIFNSKATCCGTMEKTVSQGLADVQDFGKENFALIVKKHPEFDEIYGIGRFRNSSWFRFMITLPIDALLKLFLFTKSIKLVHLLTVKSVYKGYQSRA